MSGDRAGDREEAPPLSGVPAEARQSLRDAMDAAGAGAPAIDARGIRKAFGTVVANRDASLLVAAGEIHAVVGENGAGKSTLVRMLAGSAPPDGGTVRIFGRDVTGWTTRQAIAAGVGMVHQHFMLVPTLTVAENLVLGRESRRGMQLDTAAAIAATRALSERTGLVVEATQLVADLSVGEAQRVEILKVLHRGARLLILDEPTAVLSPSEVGELWTVLRTLRVGGCTIVLITHKLDEVLEISDVVTVMRAGQTVGRIATGAATMAGLARMVVGRDVALSMGAPEDVGAGAHHNLETRFADVRPRDARTTAEAPPLLSVVGLTVPSSRRPVAVRNVSFDVHAGEILGVAGVDGNGQTELVEALAGLRQPTAGRIMLGGRDMTRMDVRARGAVGISHIPEDRQQRGLVLDFSVADNLVLGMQHRFTRHGAMDRHRVAANAATQIARFDIRPPQPDLPVAALSGGNQQKVVVAREMGRDFSVLLAAQPTRGVDVGAIEFIHARLREARAAGKGVLLVSSDLAEVLALSDRIAVMYGGALVATLPRREATVERLGRFMLGAARADPFAPVMES